MRLPMPHRRKVRNFEDALSSQLGSVVRKVIPRGAAHCELQDIVSLNYAVEPALLYHALPRGLYLDTWEGKAWVSLSAFTVTQGRFFGIPLHAPDSFTQVNLQFYVKRQLERGWRHGTCSLTEAVPNHAMATLLHATNRHPYIHVPTYKNMGDWMREDIAYSWGHGGKNILRFYIPAERHVVAPDTLEAFFMDRLFSYAQDIDGNLTESRISRLPWIVGRVTDYVLDMGDLKILPSSLWQIFENPPQSALYAEGSEVYLESIQQVSMIEKNVAMA